MKIAILTQILVNIGLLTLFNCLVACSSSSPEDEIPLFGSKALLGESLFSDTNLSFNRSQSCATCHNPDRAFIDDRINAEGETSAVSLGDDGVSLGDRNTPTAAYAQFSPDFHVGTKQRFNSQQSDYVGELGGQFLDGRESNLSAQAGGPPTNAIEMGMPDKASVVERIKENSDYISAFEFLYGDDIFEDIENAYSAMAESIAEFEKTEEFNPFDSKYDRFLAGEYQYNPLSKAAEGKALFFSQQFTNCSTCHQLHPNGYTQETFSSYEYHNIGVPVNHAARLANGKPAEFIDQGLLDNPQITSSLSRGKFKTSTLRNVAVTGPYMHNGVFKELKTVIEFYDHFITDSEHVINPETGLAWGIPEVEDNVASNELEDGRKLTETDVDALVCFLRTLTDTRYEHLIEEKGIDCSESF